MKRECQHWLQGERNLFKYPGLPLPVEEIENGLLAYAKEQIARDQYQAGLVTFNNVIDAQRALRGYLGSDPKYHLRLPLIKRKARILDMARTALNVTSDMVVTKTVDVLGNTGSADNQPPLNTDLNPN